MWFLTVDVLTLRQGRQTCRGPLCLQVYVSFQSATNQGLEGVWILQPINDFTGAKHKKPADTDPPELDSDTHALKGQSKNEIVIELIECSDRLETKQNKMPSVHY